MKLSPTFAIEQSKTATINDLTQQKKAQKIEVYNLSVGEPLVATPKEIIDSLKNISDEQTRYPPIAGIPKLRALSSQWTNNEYNTKYSDDQTLVTCGGKFGIYLACKALLGQDDEVLVIAPYWVSYPSIIEMVGAIPKIVNSKPDEFKIDVNELEKSCSSKTNMLILNNACNPTGVIYSKDELQDILDFAQKKDIIVLSDEVYSGLVFDDNEFISCGSFPEHKDNVVVIQSCSKNFAMTGWRVGFVFGPENLIKSITKIQSHTITGTSTISQAVATVALENAHVITKNIKDQIQKRRDTFVATFNKIFPAPIKAPKSALYSFIPIESFGTAEKDSSKFCMQALEKFNVAMVPGIAFGQEGYVRCSFGADEELIVNALQELKKSIP